MNSQQTRCLAADSSVIIALAEINLMDIITTPRWEVIVPNAVYEEVAVRGRNRPGSMELENLVNLGKVKILAPRDRALVEVLHDPLGIGKAEAVALAVENNRMVILDDRIARPKTKSMGLEVIGTIGLLRLAYDEGLIERDRLIRALRMLREHGFRISDEIIREVLERIG